MKLHWFLSVTLLGGIIALAFPRPAPTQQIAPKIPVKKKLPSFAALGSLLAALVLAAAPAWAENLDGRIRSLGDELSRLKSEQMELKKDATAAQAALPDFSYRPGNGVMIEAADKAWALRFSIEANFDMNFEAGRADAGRTDGEVFGRRFRPYIWYCINNCFTEIEAGWDMDGFGTGNGKNSTNTAIGSYLQSAVAHIHFEQVNSWLPTLNAGMNVSGTISSYRQGGSSTGAQLEYDLLSRNNGWNTGVAGQGINLNWNNLSLNAIGIPGTMRAQVARATFGAGDGGLSSFTDKVSWSVYARIEPFTQAKNKWLSGLGFEMGSWFCNADKTNESVDYNSFVSCGRNRVQDHGPGGRQTLFEFRPAAGTGVTNGGPKGMAHYLIPGIGWNVGPYTLRVIGGFQNYNFKNHAGAASGGGEGIDTKATNFLIGHDLFIWSPKGFLTGSSSEPGSVLVGYHFERNDYSCGHTRGLAACARSSDSAVPGANGVLGANQYSRNRILLNEWDVWYFLTHRLSLGVACLWYDASNLTAGRTAAGENLGVFSAGCNTCNGKGGDWLSMTVRARLNF